MEKYMTEALIEAKKSLYDDNEVPVGCVFIYKDDIIARGHNLVNLTKNPTRHAEFVCVDAVLQYCKDNAIEDYNQVFKEITVVVTVEPCIMCMSALYNLKVKSIIFGCKNDRFGGQTVINVANYIQNETSLQGGVNEDEAMELLKNFYKMTNPSAPVPAKSKKNKPSDEIQTEPQAGSSKQ